ncbi:SIS domain-containing protein [Candidatus Pelagibacter sp.]|nr:SIS domain-containing protein [Candidatus Pelagibacter sp.]
MKYLKKYSKDFLKAYKNIDLKKIDNIEKILIEKIKEKKNIFTCGNGGSASIANHFLCDFNKGIKISSRKKLLPRVYSLSENVELITAISNDNDFSDIFEHQLENLSNKDDILITFSCSGNSKNILNVLKFAKKKGIFTINLSGFNSKIKNKLADINFNIGVKNYGISEDIFQSIMHMISQSIRRKFSSKTKEII